MKQYKSYGKLKFRCNGIIQPKTMTPSQVAVNTFLLSFWGVVMIFFSGITCNLCLSFVPSCPPGRAEGRFTRYSVCSPLYCVCSTASSDMFVWTTEQPQGCLLTNHIGTSKSMINHQRSNFYHKEEMFFVFFCIARLQSLQSGDDACP